MSFCEHVQHVFYNFMLHIVSNERFMICDFPSNLVSVLVFYSFERNITACGYLKIL